MTYSSLRFSRFFFSSVQSCILFLTPSLALENGDRFELAWFNASDLVLMGCSGTPNLPPYGDSGRLFCSVVFSEVDGSVMNKRALIRVVVGAIHGCARMVLHDATAATRVLLLLEAEASIGVCRVGSSQIGSGRCEYKMRRKKDWAEARQKRQFVRICLSCV